MKKQLSIVGAGLVAFALSSVTVYGQSEFGMGGPERAMGDRPGIMLPMMLRALNLTAEQRAQVQKIMATHRPTFQKLLSQLRAVQKEMADRLFVAGEVKEGDLASQAQRIAQLRNQLAQEGLNTVLEIRRVLTPEQLAKAAQLRKRMEALRDEMRSLFEKK